jgi:hypothetical protein
MSFVAQDADTLRRAIASGQKRVRFPDGREVEYRSLSEMREVLRMIETAVENSAGDPPSRSFVAGF